ncbi:MAG TPA: hypothetical protein VN033_08000 [Vulgatibacter sp.]|nr:hypothetical protein [Vulgatibacter sp.]
MCRSSVSLRGLLLSVLSIGVAVGCGSAEPEPIPDEGPQITKFFASPASIEAGEAAVLSWETTGAISISITPEGGEPIDLGGASAASGSVEVRPASTARYELEAAGSAGGVARAAAKVTVGLPQPPAVDFEAKDETIGYGASTELSWQTERATHVAITAGEETIFDEDQPEGTIEVSPTATTEYTIVATGFGGEDTRSVTVAVAPVVESFEPSATTVFLGGTVTLRWRTKGADRLAVSSAEGFSYDASEEELDEGEVEAPVGSSGRFTLTVGRGAIEVASMVELVVDTSATVVGFESVPPAITEVGTVTLSWKVLNAQFVTIEADPGGYVVQQQPAEGSAEVSVVGATTFLLTASGLDGSTTSRTLVVPSVPVPVITSFAALPARVGAGEETELAWTTSDAVRVEIEGYAPPEPLPANGSVRVAVASDTTVVLRAFNAADHAVESTIDVTVGPPTILAFDTSAGKVHAGAPLSFSWTNLGGVSLRVLDPGGAVPGCATTDPAVVASGACSANAPSSDGEAQYTLEVTNGAMESSVSEPVAVVVRDGPILDRFETLDPLVNQGDPVRLSWVVGPDRQGEAPTLVLEDDLGTVYPIDDPALGEATIRIQDPGTRTLRLVATSSHGTPDQAEVEVEVVALPTLTFTASAPAYDPASGNPVLLSWTTTGAVSIAIFELDGAGAPILPPIAEYTGGRAVGGSAEVRPTGPKDYRAVAANSLGATAAADVHVDAPIFDIISFTASPSNLPAGGGATTLEWQTVGATSVSLDIPQTPVMSPGAPPFMDISSSSSKQTLPVDVCDTTYPDEDCPILTFPAGFTFPFDGVPRTEARVYHNGLISFDTARTGNNWTNSSLPSSANAFAHLVLFWDDLFPGPHPLMWDLGADSRGTFLVVQWTHFTNYAAVLDLNFQAILWEDGAFEYRYGTMSPDTYARGSSATIGYQNYTGTSGLLISYDTEVPGLPNSGYTFTPPSLPVNGNVQVSTTSSRTYTLTAHGPGDLMMTRTIPVTVGP